MYEMLVGRDPFHGRSMQALGNAHLKELPTPISQLKGDVPLELDLTIMACLAKDPGRRQLDGRLLTAGVLASRLRDLKRSLDAAHGVVVDDPMNRTDPEPMHAFMMRPDENSVTPAVAERAEAVIDVTAPASPGARRASTPRRATSDDTDRGVPAHLIAGRTLEDAFPREMTLECAKPATAADAPPGVDRAARTSTLSQDVPRRRRTGTEEIDPRAYLEQPTRFLDLGAETAAPQRPVPRPAAGKSLAGGSTSGAGVVVRTADPPASVARRVRRPAWTNAVMIGLLGTMTVVLTTAIIIRLRTPSLVATQTGVPEQSAAAPPPMPIVNPAETTTSAAAPEPTLEPFLPSAPATASAVQPIPSAARVSPAAATPKNPAKSAAKRDDSFERSLRLMADDPGLPLTTSAPSANQASTAAASPKATPTSRPVAPTTTRPGPGF